MAQIVAFEYVFPLVGCKTIPMKDGVQIEQIYGTAFSLKNGNFLVAGHSIKNALQHELVGLGYIDKGYVRFHKVTHHEIIADYDIGFVRAEMPEAKALHWNFDELPMLGDIQTVGFPYALDLQNLDMRIRAFRGYIVSAPKFYRLPSNPSCYELSFHCPRGLSGAPLFTVQTTPKVKGIIIGNQSTEMLIYSDKEIIKEGKETIFERYEATQFGIAIQTRSLQNIKSIILGNSVLKYLTTVNLI